MTQRVGSAVRRALLPAIIGLMPVSSPLAQIGGTGGGPAVDRLAHAATGGCRMAWVPTFGGPPGTDDTVRAVAVFDDGGGPAVYVGGQFTMAGTVPVNGVAEWDGTRWSPLGAGVSDPLFASVHALAVFDDGSGPALYAGGRFTTAGGVAASHVARWDGSTWSPVGGGMNAAVTVLTVFDDGSGPALYAGGQFTVAGGAPARFVARWDGSGWSPLGGGLGGLTPCVLALTSFDDGSGPGLYAAGCFTTAGGAPARFVARWDGTGWSPVGGGTDSVVRALAVFDDGNGAALYAGGDFMTAGGVAARRLAKWDGTSWSPLGRGANGTVFALTVFVGSRGPVLCAGGRFQTIGNVSAQWLAIWNGSSWSGFSGPNGEVAALAVLDDGSGPALFAGGRFSGAYIHPASNIARFSLGSGWSALGPSRLESPVGALTVFDDGSGPALFAIGGFSIGTASYGIAKWDGRTWLPLGAGIRGRLTGLAAFDDGTGPALYAGGWFTGTDVLQASNIARWDGRAWSAVASGGRVHDRGLGTVPQPLDSGVEVLGVFDLGGGSALYASGSFRRAGTTAVNHIAKWDGIRWSPLGSGLSRRAFALAAYDDGSGPALYAGGEFRSAGGTPASYVAKWDGRSWSPVGSGTSYIVSALAVYDDGSGPALYAGGGFTAAGGVPASRIARWDGSTWSSVGGGVGGWSVPWVSALMVWDDSRGPALHVGGSFTTAGGVAANHLARWDGRRWSALGAGMNHAVVALAGFDDGLGPALYAGGVFSASPAGDSYLAKWGCQPITGVPGCAGNAARLAALAPTARLGAPLPMQVSGSAATNGVGTVFFGAPGFDAQGCGAVLPGLGELLLAAVPAPLPMASAPLAGATHGLSVLVPNVPALKGVTAHFQAAAVAAGTWPIELTNALAVALGP